MSSQESSETRRVVSRSVRAGALVAVIAVVVVIGVVVVAWVMSNNEGTVAADKAQIDMTYTGDGTSYVGDRKIIQGTVSVAFSNESTGEVTIGAYRYETGSDGLAEELAFVQEGNKAVPTGELPAGPFYVELMQTLPPGSHTLSMDLQPGTYIFDAGPVDFVTAGLWRVAVIEVVDE